MEDLWDQSSDSNSADKILERNDEQEGSFNNIANILEQARTVAGEEKDDHEAFQVLDDAIQEVIGICELLRQ